MSEHLSEVISASALPPTIAELGPRNSPRALVKAIFDAEAPEREVRALPAQTIYTILQAQGIESSTDLLVMVSQEQMRALLDFDCWQGDTFDEARFWTWLSLTEEGEEFTILQRILKSVDLKLVALLIARYVEVITNDERTDEAPGPGFYTPDRGHTWLHINIPDADRHFLLARFLALIFESSAELFYQLTAIPNVSTQSMLEEEAFTDRSKRLASEGVPDFELAHELNRLITVPEVEKQLRSTDIVVPIADVRPVITTLPPRSTLQPFGAIFSSGMPGIEEELTLLLNAAVVHFGINFSEHNAVVQLASQLAGAINIGLERSLKIDSTLTIKEILERVGLRQLYRLGLSLLMPLRKAALKISDDVVKASGAESELFLLVAGCREVFPLLPVALNEAGIFEHSGGSLASGYRAINHLSEIDNGLELLRNK